MGNKNGKQVRQGSGVPQWSPKQVTKGNVPAKTRIPKSLPGAEHQGETICWRFSLVDTAGPWGFHKVDGPILLEILEKLGSFESMKMSAVFGPGSEMGKDYDIEALQAKNSEAWNRLVELERDDQTQVSRLRFSGARRLYGFRQENVFFILWWDPSHEVYPSPKKNT